MQELNSDWFVTIYLARYLPELDEKELSEFLARVTGREIGMGGYFVNIYTRNPEIVKAAVEYLVSKGERVVEITGRPDDEDQRH